ncbi:SRPBCC family protein [Deminuibacter soli]|uniref:Cell division inhibitor n=1 Tax=Deminuibacter soli TaxID=2291815 RepID=A0A3E1NRM4_9BACT|nr:SRPBCC family protein [Deminuibacter soli]RFM30560.1 hypothetical protein DXN05_06290 [Deminuibacter soli]
MSRVYQIKKEQFLPVSLAQAWDFFSRPANLKIITPAYMNFTVTSEPWEGSMYPGQLIEYKVKPLLGIPLYWMTEITHVQEQVFFVDEQRYGPYSFWHHQHHFETVPGGVKMTDRVHYKIPFWLLGDIANTLLVRKQLEQIFAFRFQKAVEIFGTI